MTSIGLQSFRFSACVPTAQAALAKRKPRAISFDESPGDVQVLWVSFEEVPGAVGAVEKNIISISFLNGTHSTWSFLERNLQHLDVTWTFIERNGPCDVQAFVSCSATTWRETCL